jgi:hypothetical protein
MKNFLFFILFLNSTLILSQIKLVCEYNLEWQYEWYHNDKNLGITTNVLYSIGKDVSGEYKVIITNDCDTKYQVINIKNKEDKNTYYFKNFSILSCNQILYNDEWYNELQSDLAFIIFPNPAKDLLNFRVYRGSSSFYKIIIYDYLGKKVIEKELNGDGNIDISSLSKGTYHFEVLSEKSKKSEILIIF